MKKAHFSRTCQTSDFGPVAPKNVTISMTRAQNSVNNKNNAAAIKEKCTNQNGDGGQARKKTECGC